MCVSGDDEAIRAPRLGETGRGYRLSRIDRGRVHNAESGVVRCAESRAYRSYQPWRKARPRVQPRRRRPRVARALCRGCTSLLARVAYPAGGAKRRLRAAVPVDSRATQACLLAAAARS